MNKGLFRSQMIGSYVFDVQYIYNQTNHAIYHLPLALVNPDSEDGSSITGELKVSIAVQGPGDE